MAKKTAKGGDKPSRRAETLDERDVRNARTDRPGTEDTRTASQRRQDQEDYVNEKERTNREDLEDSGDVDLEEVDVDQLPINHPTIIGPQDTQLPPEATPREGRTSPHPPVSPAPKEGEDAARARSRGGEEQSELVVATQLGYYDHTRRRPGDVFRIRASEFSKRWMRKAPEGAAERVTTANQAIREQNAATRALRAGGMTTAITSQPPNNTATSIPGSASPIDDD